MGGIVRRAKRAARATGHLVLGLLLVPLCVLALLQFLVSLVLSVTFVGLLLVPYTARVNRAVAGLARRLASRWLGRPVTARYGPRTGILNRARLTLNDPMTWRDAGWLALHLVAGPVLLALALGLWAGLGFDLSLPFWWWRPFPEHSVELTGIAVDSWFRVVTVVPVHFAAVAALALWAIPLLAAADAHLTRLILTTPERVRLAERVAELTETRAAALDAHGAELRRIERDLHDGAQARLVSIAMRLGIAERMMAADPGKAAELVAEARRSTEETMTELRGIIRGMYPPILSDRGLPGAVAALAAACPVPVTTTTDGVGRLPAAVEAAAYFVVAEALTNVAKHSGASSASVRLSEADGRLTVVVGDNGRGAADETGGTGLSGIRRRVAAFDGRTDLASPPGGPTTLIVELPCH
ncbi:sensor histidine kinase [Microtetraspora niveoalba]|uniref:sensor histidine kinase n=1 Tax=Microtetraspora niveoalba TaxID=46175 RepID=UPI000A95F9A9|nr:sensor histidine kinase [Microtetraspora niveoalba]